MSLLLSLRSETLKLKRTLSLYLCLLGAAFGPLMSLLEDLRGTNETKKVSDWTVHFLDTRDMLTGVLLPLYVILICTLLLQIEYKDRAWKQVLTSPQRLIDIFSSKFITLQLMVLLFLVCHTVFLAITGIITEMAQPQLYNGSPDLLRIVRANTASWLLVLGMSSIQFWLSLRFKNFIPPLAIGLAAWFLGPMMAFEFKSSLTEYYPYAFTIVGVFPGFESKAVAVQWYSVITALLFLSIAFLEFRTRKIRG
jgi:lantibiotic transport system permease protein